MDAYHGGVERYRQMQKRFYSEMPAEDNYMKQAVVGCFAEHEAYPYEEWLLAQMEPDTANLIALDFGCGPGRMIRRLAPYFERVDGVDISASCLQTARRWTAELRNQPKLYENDGVVLNGVSSDTYDFVYSTIAYHHIASYEIRMSLLQEFLRVLKPGGRLAIQMFYTTTPRDQWAQHVDWRESKDDAEKTNGYHDVRITPENTRQVEEDFLSVGFEDFDFKIAPYPPPPHPKGTDSTDFIFIYARRPL